MSGLVFDLEDAGCTEAFGAAVAAVIGLQPGAVIFLVGELGAGKTTLARGFLRALGLAGTVRSPTYTLLEPYRLGDRDVLHMDLYRLADPAELWQLGLDAYPPENSVWLVEWPERGGALLPAPGLRIHLRYRGGSRQVEVDGDPQLLYRIADTYRSK